MREFALERVVGECRRDARLRGRGADEAVGRGRDRGSSRGRVLDPRDLLGRHAVAPDAIRRRVASLVDGNRFGSKAVGTKSRDARAADAHETRLGGVIVVDRPLARLAPPVAAD